MLTVKMDAIAVLNMSSTTCLSLVGAGFELN